MAKIVNQRWRLCADGSLVGRFRHRQRDAKLLCQSHVGGGLVSAVVPQRDHVRYLALASHDGERNRVQVFVNLVGEAVAGSRVDPGLQQQLNGLWRAADDG